MNNQKRIDIVVKYFWPVAAGIETNILETYKILVERGFDVTIHTSLDTLTEKNCLPKEETIQGLKVKRYPFKWFSYWPAIDYSKTDIVALHNFNLLPHLAILLFCLVRRLFKKQQFKLFVTPHGGFNPDWSIFSSVVALVKQITHYTVGTLLINLAATGVRAVSVWEKKEMVKKFVKPNLVAVIENGIEDEAYADVDALASEDIKSKVASYGEYLIQIGRVYSIKNYETTIRALTQIPERIKYVIAGPIGSEAYYASLQSLIKELGLEHRVIFAGVIRGIDKYYLIKHAKLMVHMAIWESFCNVVHEGMSQGLVCIVANNTALPLLVKEGERGYLIETKDIDALAQKINYVLEHFESNEIKRIQENNRTFGLQNSWRSTALRMEAFYEGKLHVDA